MEGTSGLIIAFVVVIWAAYFIPLVLRRYDEGTQNAALDVPSPTHQVVNGTSAPQPRAKVVRPTVTRETARIAARRRRNTLLVLVALLGATVGASITAFISWWFVAAPALLIVAWLVTARIMVRKELGLSSPRARNAVSVEEWVDEPLAEETVVEKGPSLFARMRSRVSQMREAAAVKRMDPADTEPTVVVSHQFEEHDPDRSHVMEDVPLEAHALDEQLQIAVPSASLQTGEALWDPLPVTVPTYVTKPRAGRTVRTIDFNQPGAWTSGHVEGEQTELPARHDEGPGDDQRAVGH